MPPISFLTERPAMPKTKMMRATKPLKYETRRLVAGDVFEVDNRYVTRLLATRKAVVVREPADVPPPPPAVKAKIEAAVAPPPAPPSTAGAPTTQTFSRNDQSPPPDAQFQPPSETIADDLAAARLAYRDAFGRPADARWSAATVRSKIAEKASGA